MGRRPPCTMRGPGYSQIKPLVLDAFTAQWEVGLPEQGAHRRSSLGLCEIDVVFLPDFEHLCCRQICTSEFEFTGGRSPPELRILMAGISAPIDRRHDHSPDFSMNVVILLSLYREHSEMAPNLVDFEFRSYH